MSDPESSSEEDKRGSLNECTKILIQPIIFILQDCKGGKLQPIEYNALKNTDFAIEK